MDALKTFLLAHFEKLLLGVCLLVMGYFIYGAVTIKPYEKRPDDFTEVTTRARKNVEAAEPQLADLTDPDFTSIFAKLTAPIDPSTYAHATRWMRPFEFGLSFRNQPSVLALEKPPIVQANRGLLPLFKTDLNGKRLTRKVKKTDAHFAVASVYKSSANNADTVRETMMREEQARLQAMQSGSGEAMFLGNQSLYTQTPTDTSDNNEEEAAADRPAAVNVAMRTRRTVLTSPTTPTKAEAKKAVAIPKKDEYVEEFIVDMAPTRWVEIMAAFPHAEQIKEYVKALHEPAEKVGLRYAMAEVERQELTTSLEWSEWKPIALIDQFKIVSNAISFEPESYPQVTMRGLAMNIPLLQTTFKPLLDPARVLDLKAYSPGDLYTIQELDPNAVVKKVIKRDPSSRPPIRSAKIVPKEAPLATTPLPQLQRQNATVNLGMGRDGKPLVSWNNHFTAKEAMVRFWDFTIQPNKAYRYRIRVKVYNPNFNRADVARAEYANEKYLIGPWSLPSEEVVVPNDTEWYAVKQQSPRNDRANIQVLHWDSEVGEWLVQDFVHRPGDLIGLGEPKKTVETPLYNVKENRWKVDPVANRDRFDARSVLVDIEGKVERMPGDRTPFRMPRELIALNQFGDLVCHEVNSDINNNKRVDIEKAYSNTIKELKEGAKEVKTTSDGSGGSVDPIN